MLEILNLGGGVQSTALAMMSIAGELPKLDCAIFADTGWEPEPVYRHVEFLETYCKPHFPVHRVSCGRNIRADAITAQVRGVKAGGVRWASMPLYTLQESGDKGMIRRQCTTEYKIEPIERFIKRELLGMKLRQRLPTSPVVRQWFGISWDEWQRMRTPEGKWKEHFYPLCNRRITRNGCLNWLDQHGFAPPPRSACIGCPFHHDDEWGGMKRDRPEDFEDACRVDDAIRNNGGTRGQVFLHRSCKPLRDVDLRTDVDRGQGLLPIFEAGCNSGGHCFS